MSAWRPAIMAALPVLLTACSTPGAQQPTSGSSSAAQSVPKRMTAAIRGTPAALSQQKTMKTVGNIPGLDAIEELTHAGMTHADDSGVLHPQLAEAVPTIENGQWRLLGGGRMGTAWEVKPDARWHD